MRSGLEALWPVAPDGQNRHRRALVVIATDGGVLEVQDLSDLLGDGREHLTCRRTARHEGGHAP